MWIFTALYTLLVVVAAADDPQQRPVYVTNADSLDISRFLVNVVTGHANVVSHRVKAGDGVRNMAITPDARFAYAGNSGASTISAYSVGPEGMLAPLPGAASTVVSGDQGPVGGVVSPDSRTLYFAHVAEEKATGGSIAAFTIAANGEIHPLGPPLVTTEHHPRALVMTPDGKFLYAGHGDPGVGRNTSVGAITSYAVNPGGTLTPIGSPIHAGRFCGDSTITPNGHRLYVLCQDFDQIFGFAIASDGGLAPLPGSPYTVTGEFPEGIASSPDGRFIFVASPGRVTKGSVSSFSAGADGALTQVGLPHPGGFGPVGIAPLPNGKFVYASSNVDSSPADLGALNAYAVGPSGGLQPLAGSPFPDGGKGPAYGSFSVLPNQGPVAQFAARADNGGNKLSVRFDASRSTDSDGRVAQYAWDFGDGVVLNTADGRQITHVYARAGKFTVTLIVTDNEGCSTALVSIGRTMLCNGGAAAATSRTITVGP